MPCVGDNQNTANKTIVGEEEYREMLKERVGGSKSEFAGSVDRKRINDALDKQLERSSLSTSRATINGKDLSVLMGKHPDHHRDAGAASQSKNNASDGIFFAFCLYAYTSQKRNIFFLFIIRVLFLGLSFCSILFLVSWNM